MDSIVLVIIGVVVVALIGIVFLNSVKVVEKPEGAPEEIAQSAAARERVYGEGRLKRFGDVTAEQMPRAVKLWERAKPRIAKLVARAQAKGIAVTEEAVGLELDAREERILIYVDATGPDPIFLVWTENVKTDESSDLEKIRQVRVVAERVEAWIDRAKV